MNAYYPEWMARAQSHRFTDEQWQSICDAIGPGPYEGLFRFNLEMRVTRFLGNRRQPRFDPVRERNTMKAIAALSLKLRKKLEGLDQRAWHNPSDIGITFSSAVYGKEYRRWSALIEDLREGEARAVEQARYIKGQRGPKDLPKKQLWWHAIALYEHFTGKRAGASNPSSGKGEAKGPCIRFLIALTLCVPNEKKPNGHQLRPVIRDYQRFKRKGWKPTVLGGSSNPGQTAA
jgi:hypothetical protein